MCVMFFKTSSKILCCGYIKNQSIEILNLVKLYQLQRYNLRLLIAWKAKLVILTYFNY